MSEIYLRVFTNKSELVLPDGTVQVFSEGVMNESARLRYQKIVTELANNYLEKQILLCRDKASSLDFSQLNQNHLELFHKLVDSITSEVGRALVGLTVLQLCIKAIEPDQSIRLHKGSRGTRDFSWQNGISMRSLDKLYITPVKAFQDLATQTLVNLNKFLENTATLNKECIKKIIWQHINQSDYAARLMEIAMHSLIQAMQEHDLLDENSLKPLSQMRSANKKHGNVGDIEILCNLAIIEVWDAKYGKAYLRDELEELKDKLENHPTVEVAGFVTSVEPERWSELSSRCQEIEEMFGITLKIMTFDKWVDEQFVSSIKEENLTESMLSSSWLIAYTESLAQKRRHIAPIDEPCYQWLSTLKKILEP